MTTDYVRYLVQPCGNAEHQDRRVIAVLSYPTLLPLSLSLGLGRIPLPRYSLG